MSSQQRLKRWGRRGKDGATQPAPALVQVSSYPECGFGDTISDSKNSDCFTDLEGEVRHMPSFPITGVCSGVSGEAHSMGQDGHSFITASEGEWH